MFKLEFPANNKTLAAAIGRALVEYAGGTVAGPVVIGSEEHTAIIAEVPANVVELGKELRQEVKTASAEFYEKDRSTEEVHAELTSAKPGDKTDRNNVDEKGVGKNPDFCGNAQIPFNQSGKKKGQWKKKAGVDEALYDAWYASELVNTPTPVVKDTPVDTGKAFSGKDTAATIDKTFNDAGEFMAWIAEQQTAELLTQGDIDSAYQMTSTQVHDLFNPQLFPDAVAAVYGFLAPIAAGEA